MVKRTLVALALLLLPVADAAAATRETKPFRGCGELVRYARAEALDVIRPYVGPRFPPPPSGGGGGGTGGGTVGGEQDAVSSPTPAPVAGSDFSGTNVQEQGVDEPDSVKTDGRLMYVATDNGVRAVDVSDGTPRAVGRLDLGGYSHELLLHGNKLLAISEPRDGADSAGIGAVIREIDVSDPAAMRVLRIMQVEGRFVDARMVDGTVRAVFKSQPEIDTPVLPPGTSATGKRARRAVRRVLRRTSTRDWRPSYKLADRTAGRSAWRPLVPCDGIRRPGLFSGLGVLTVLTIDVDRGLPPVDSDALFADAETVYASSKGLYLATQRWVDPLLDQGDVPTRSATTIHKLDTTVPGRTDYAATGEVRGYLLNQWSLSEREGVLRVATTDAPAWFNDGDGPASESFVTTLGELGDRLEPLGQVGGLGHGEEIQAVRFIGDKGFVVTFRQVDPLYTIDLSNPLQPRVLGELKVLGYSAYLHPVGDNLLLGVGQDADARGRRLGTQLSLFDVSDLRNPRRLHQHALADGSFSDVEWDHHAFLYWPPTQTTVIPVYLYDDDSESSFTGAVGFTVDAAAGINPIGRLQHPGTQQEQGYVSRATVIGDRLYTVSNLGIKASALNSFGDIGFLPFE
jgi:uncharacterized secreted protein with C-terminal beta-propeller domain